MNELSRGANLAWKIAAAETAAARRPTIDKPHLLLGLLSLGKALAAAEQLEDTERRELADEAAVIEGVFTQLGLQPVSVRRGVRQRVGIGAHRHGPGAAISRSDACKLVFVRAAELAGERPAACLHLLVALLERPDPHLDLLLRDAGVGPDALAREALLRLLLNDVVEEARRSHGVALVFESGVYALLRKKGTEQRGAPDALRQIVSDLVLGPLGLLAASGKLARQPRWRVAEDQGGVYVIPAEG